MKYITNYKIFENSESDDTKQGLEFILLDLKDIGVNYSIIGRSKFLDNPHDDWFKNTRVERGFTSYFSLNVSTNKEQIENIISIVKECINYMTNQGWKYHTKIDKGVRIVDIDINKIVDIFNYNRDISKYLGQIHIHFWKI
jgi:hypothetical protein